MNTNTKILVSILLVGLGIAGRLMPHYWNFTPMIAIALFCAAYMGPKYSLSVPLIAMVLSDIFIGFYNPAVMISVYASIAIGGLIGSLLKNRVRILPIAGISLLSSILFYLVTNAAVWAFSGMYPATGSGLIASYVAAIPFFKNMIVGDLWYSFMFFGAYEGARYVARYVKNVGLVEVR